MFNSYLEQNYWQIMMKVGNNYDNQTLNIINGNNHSKLVDFSFENMICSNVDKIFCKKNENHQGIDVLNIKKGVVNVKPKSFRWNFDLDNNFQKITELHPSWML
jgi:hypothetical protein